MIRVLLLIPTLDRSGAEKQLSLLATGLPRSEFEVHVAALTRGGPYETPLRENGIPVTVLHKRLKGDPLALWKLRRLIRDLRPDVLHTWLFAANAYGRLAVGRRHRPNVVISERCVDTWKSGWQLALDRRLIPRTDRLVANSDSVAGFYRDRGFPSDRITVIPNGIECRHSENVDRTAKLRELDIPPEAGIVGYIGRLARQKRVDDLIWAMQLLWQITSPVYLLIVGDGPEKEKLVARARHFGCDHLIRFLGHRDDSLELIDLLDVFWLASDFEGLSNSVMEAMAAGVPVVASDIPPNRELVVHGETGYLVRVGDSVGFAQFASRLLEDSELAQRLGTAGQNRVRAHFSVDATVNAHAALYRQLVGSPVRRTATQPEVEV